MPLMEQGDTFSRVWPICTVKAPVDAGLNRGQPALRAGIAHGGSK
jgi:hypothetical protein